MKITLFTTNNNRHNYLINLLSKISDELFVLQECGIIFPGILFAKAYPKNNPITTQHVEMSVQTKQGQQIDKKTLINFFNAKLQKHMVPKRIIFEKIDIGHRLKRA